MTDSDSLVFQSSTGTPIHIGNWRKRILYPAAIRAGVVRDDGPPHPHDFRHTFVRVASEAGYSIFEVSRILGHSSISLTADLYGSFFPDEDPAKRAAFDQFVAG
jgi:integrase